MAFYICGKYCGFVCDIMSEAKTFSELTGAHLEDIVFEKITKSNWTAGNYLFSVTCPYPGEKFKKVKSGYDYLHFGKTN